MIISRKTIDLVYALPIDKVIGQYTELKKVSGNLKGTCPFHDEKTPSFVVSPAKGIYKCFGCGKGGNNAVNFVMDKTGIQWLDAIKQLAQQNNIIIEFDDTEQAAAQIAELERKHRLGDINKFAADVFRGNIACAPAGAIRCTDEIAEAFNLGYAINSWDELQKTAHIKGISTDKLMELDLVRSSKNKYDVFRERVMFPIYNDKGLIVGFSGRTVSADAETAKYINTGDTAIFNKGKELYGIHLAKQAIHKQGYAYIVEGNWDVVMMHQYGLENTVAPCGTALTIDQLQLLKKYTTRIVFIYDADGAGRKALLKNTRLAVINGFSVECVMLPEGQDPDSYLRSQKELMAA